MLLTKEQISEQMRKHAEKKNGLHDLMVIYIGNMPVESAAGWGEIFDALKDRGLQRVGLMVTSSCVAKIIFDHWLSLPKPTRAAQQKSVKIRVNPWLIPPSMRI